MEVLSQSILTNDPKEIHRTCIFFQQPTENLILDYG